MSQYTGRKKRSSFRNRGHVPHQAPQFLSREAREKLATMQRSNPAMFAALTAMGSRRVRARGRG